MEKASKIAFYVHNTTTSTKILHMGNWVAPKWASLLIKNNLLMYALHIKNVTQYSILDCANKVLICLKALTHVYFTSSSTKYYLCSDGTAT